jgi:hypothetical protein
VRQAHNAAAGAATLISMSDRKHFFHTILLRFRVEYPAACGVLFFAKKVGGVRDTETKSFLSEHNTPPLAAGYFIFGIYGNAD